MKKLHSVSIPARTDCFHPFRITLQSAGDKRRGQRIPLTVPMDEEHQNAR